MKREERVEQIKAVGQTIIDRAEDLIGDNKYVTGYKITVTLFPDELPEIKLEKKIFPYKAVLNE